MSSRSSYWGTDIKRTETSTGSEGYPRARYRSSDMRGSQKSRKSHRSFEEITRRAVTRTTRFTHTATDLKNTECFRSRTTRTCGGARNAVWVVIYLPFFSTPLGALPCWTLVNKSIFDSDRFLKIESPHHDWYERVSHGSDERIRISSSGVYEVYNTHRYYKIYNQKGYIHLRRVFTFLKKENYQVDHESSYDCIEKYQ